MGMFDEIIVGRTYLKDLLTKEQEAILKQGDDVYQTKDLECTLGRYKIYKRKLWKDVTSFTIDLGKEKKEEKPKPKWEVFKVSQEVSFCNLIIIDGNEHWFEFRITFNDGKIDRKFLDDYTTRSKAEIEKEEEEWAIIKSYYDAHKSRLIIRLYSWIANKLMNISSYFGRKATIPKKIKEAAWKAAGKDYTKGNPIGW